MQVFSVVILFSVACATNLCTKFTPNLAKVFDCVNINMRLIRIIPLTRTESPNLEVEDFVSELIPNLQGLGAAFVSKTYNLLFEHNVIDYSELHSWSGQKFDLREAQKNTTIIFDGFDVAHPTQVDRKVSSASSVLVMENIDILDEYLVGSPRSPFHTTRTVFNIVILEKTEGAIEKIPIVLEKMRRNYGIIIAVLIFTCEDEVSI